jgi:hypothetical protein
MDKITYYQQSIIEILNAHACYHRSITPNVTSQIVIDRDHNHFMLLSVGWHQSRFIYTIAFHFALIEGKIWIQQNNTDVLVADELLERGIPATDIILGFIAPNLRIYSGFGALIEPSKAA